jgi:voltage-gated potassium channel
MIFPNHIKNLRIKLHEVIFGYDTPAGRNFDIFLIVAILLSVLVVLIDSVGPLHQSFDSQLFWVEWAFTLLFTFEYLLRLYSSQSPLAYARSFYGLVDFFSILPSYLALIESDASFLVVIRILRVLRIFRILKMIHYVSEANMLLRALINARRKILVFIVSVLALQVIFGSVMYLVEGPENGYTSIPLSIYWSIVTMTTVGFGDIVPHTDLGRFIAAITMLTGYAIIAVPTGIVSSELMHEFQQQHRYDHIDIEKVCLHCQRKGHDLDANYCKQCGTKL